MSGTLSIEWFETVHYSVASGGGCAHRALGWRTVPPTATRISSEWLIRRPGALR